jgi:multidrug efflux system membrane fusion protein
MNSDKLTTVVTEEDVDLSNSRAPRPKTGRRWLVWLVLLGLGVGAYILYEKWQAKQTAAVKQAPAGGGVTPVVVAPAKSGEISVFLNGLGSVTPFNTVTVKSRVDGQLIRVAFKEGEFAKQGDLLAEIDPRPFEVQLAQAEAQLAKDQATLNNAKVDLARFQMLASKGVIPAQQLDTQAAVVRSDDAVIKADDAQIDNAKLQIVYCIIKAPISGRIGLRLVDAGNMVHASDTNGLVVITQVQPITVLFTIPEDNLRDVVAKLRAGQQLPVDAYDRSGQTRIATGKLITLDNQIDPTTGTSRLKAVFDNKDNSLYPNQFVNARLLVDVKKNQILVPAVAIQRGPQGTFVYVVKQDNTADVRQVKVGTTEGTTSSIESGLSEGEQVVIDGVDKLRAGSRVSTSSGPSSSPNPGPSSGGGSGASSRAGSASGADAGSAASPGARAAAGSGTGSTTTPRANSGARPGQ